MILRKVLFTFLLALLVAAPSQIVSAQTILDNALGNSSNVDPAGTHLAAWAYAHLSNWLVGAQVLPCMMDVTGTYFCKVVRHSRKNQGRYTGLIMWNSYRRWQYPVPAQATDLKYVFDDQARKLVAGQMIIVGPQPILLESWKNPLSIP